MLGMGTRNKGSKEKQALEEKERAMNISDGGAAIGKEYRKTREN